MVRLNAAEVLAAKLASPAYCAVIVWLPSVRVVVANVAMLEAFSALVPNVAAPSRNVIIPVGVPAVLDVTVAVNVTDCPNVAEFSDDATVVAEVALTVWLSAVDVLPLKLASPPYVAVIEWLPGESASVANVAIPRLVCYCQSWRCHP